MSLDLPERWSFRGVDFATYAYLVRSAPDADAFPDLRGEDLLIPTIPGRRPAGKVFDARRIPISLYVLGEESGGSGGGAGNSEAERTRANLDALYAVLGARATGALVRTMPDGSTRSGTAECVKVSNIEDTVGHEIIGLLADFALADPWLYGSERTVTQATPASPTAYTLANPGTVRTHRLLLDFTGPVSNPRLTQTDSGIWVEILVAVASGTHLLVDCEAWTALNDGEQAIGSVRHSGDAPFFVLEPGENPLSVTSSSPGGSLAITYSPPYL